jgi:predicted ATP-dependent serine protease
MSLLAHSYVCAQAKAVQAALDGRLQDCKQWQQMKKMMQAKGQEVVALRQRLAKYEPQEVPSAETGATVSS